MSVSTLRRLSRLRAALQALAMLIGSSLVFAAFLSGLEGSLSTGM